jgi:cell division protein FtsW (lipid II flippase)
LRGLRQALQHRFAMLCVFGVCSFAAVAIGAYICALSGVPPALWIRNLAAWCVGAVLAVGLAFVRRTEALHVALWAAPLALLATFFSPAQEGVHRWIDAGPLHINAAMLTLPAATVALAALSREHVWAWGASFVALALLVLQPDASQATALAAVMAAIAAAASSRPLLRFAIMAGAVALATIAWFQPDPLRPVPEVEDIIELAFAIAPALALAALATLLLTAISAEALTRYQREAPRTAAWALSLCFLAWIATPYFGAYPVPWVGVGPSPIIGAWLGMGLLTGLR